MSYFIQGLSGAKMAVSQEVLEEQLIKSASDKLANGQLKAQIDLVKTSKMEPAEEDQEFIRSSVMSLSEMTKQDNAQLGVSVDKCAQGMLDIFQTVVNRLTKRMAEKEKNPPHEPIPHFFMIRDQNGNVRGYLLGTVHMLDTSSRNLLNKKMEKVLRKCDRLFVEVAEVEQIKAMELSLVKKQLADVDPQELTSARKRYLQLFAAHPEVISGQELEIFCQQLEKIGPLDAFLECLKKHAFLCDKLIGMIDNLLYEKFMTAQKKVYGLESVEMHMNAIGKLTSRQNGYSSWLHPTNPAKAQEFASVVMQHWKADEPVGGCNDPNDIERNASFCKRIMSDLSTNPKSRALYACGFAHLYDETGIIPFLESKGFEVLKTV